MHELPLDPITGVSFPLPFIIREVHVLKMLVFLSSLQFEEAKTLVTLADKFDMPSIIRLCQPVLCEDASKFHFAGFSAGTGRARTSSMVMSPTQSLDEDHDAAQWLSLAERWNLRDLKVKCQSVIVQALAYTDVGSTDAAFAKLQEHRISLNSMYSIAAVLGKCLSNFGKCACGKIFCSLHCSSCFLENTAKASRELCEGLLRECQQIVNNDK